MRIQDERGHCGIICLLLLIVIALLVFVAGRNLAAAFSVFWAEYVQRNDAQSGTETDNEVKNEGGFHYDIRAATMDRA